MKKYFKPGIFIVSLIPFLLITYKTFFNKLGPEPVKEITHHTGEWTLIFIVLTLMMTPLKNITNLNIWITFRRMLGLFVFFYATIHMLTYVVIDYRLDLQSIFKDIFTKKLPPRTREARTKNSAVPSRRLSSRISTFLTTKLRSDHDSDYRSRPQPHLGVNPGIRGHVR